MRYKDDKKLLFIIIFMLLVQCFQAGKVIAAFSQRNWAYISAVPPAPVCGTLPYLPDKMIFAKIALITR